MTNNPKPKRTRRQFLVCPQIVLTLFLGFRHLFLAGPVIDIVY